MFFLQSYNAIQDKKWKSAEKYGRVALYLTVANWAYVLSVAVIIIGISLGKHYEDCYRYYYC